MSVNPNGNDDFQAFAAGILLRVSTALQAEDGLSLANQEKQGRAVASEYGVPVVAIYTDAGVSGDLYQRGGLQDALTDMKAGRINLLIAYDLSRVTWSPEHRPRIFREIAQTGGRLHVHLMGGIIRPGDYQQEFFAGMQTQADQFYRQHIRSLCVQGARQAALEGRQPCRKLSPYGYHIVKTVDIIRGHHGEDMAGRYVIIESEAAWVRKIYDWLLLERLSLSEVVRRLTEGGAPTKQGGEWTRSSVYKMLHNPVYKGAARYGNLKHRKDETRKGRVSDATGKAYVTMSYFEPAPESQIIYIPAPPLVSASTWQAACDILAENQKQLSGRQDNRNMLTGIARCPICRLPMQGTGKKPTGKPGEDYGPYYKCRHDTPRRAPGGKVCSTRLYPTRQAEGLVIQAIHAALTRQDVLIAMQSEWCQKTRSEMARSQVSGSGESDRKTSLQSDMKNIEEKRRALLSASGTGEDAEFWAGALRELSAAWRETKANLSALAAMPATRESPAPTPGKKIDPRFAPDVVAALTQAEAVLTDSRVSGFSKWKIAHALIESVQFIDERAGSSVKNHKEPRPQSVEVTFKPFFEGESEVGFDATVSHTKSWRHRDDFAPVTDAGEKDLLLEAWRAGRYPSLELLIADALPLLPYAVALHTVTETNAALIRCLRDALPGVFAMTRLLPVVATPTLFPSDVDWDTTECAAYFAACETAGEILPPPQLLFD